MSAWRLLCRVGLHVWVETIGNYPGEDRWWSKVECSRCGANPGLEDTA